ncbi:molybdenum cofactor guanylyltransferase [Paraglaciecola sp.]|uniref:molybdenum cofactor guanylyltransferase n=1 Tax=Paraglaciecola sp. TaxID=1920173 RepID=UPI0030F387CB
MQASLMAVILAGGKSSRMGQDKATRYSPKLQATLIEQSLSLLSQLDDCDVVISSNTYVNGIKDIIPDCGPLSGIHAVFSSKQSHSRLLEQKHSRGFLFIPVDMPKLSVTLLEALILFAQQNHCATYPNNSFLPCYVPAKAELLSVLSQLLQGTDWSVRYLLEQLDARSMPWHEEKQLVNINNPHDWQQHCI